MRVTGRIIDGEVWVLGDDGAESVGGGGCGAVVNLVSAGADGADAGRGVC